MCAVLSPFANFVCARGAVQKTFYVTLFSPLNHVTLNCTKEKKFRINIKNSVNLLLIGYERLLILAPSFIFVLILSLEEQIRIDGFCGLES